MKATFVHLATMLMLLTMSHGSHANQQARASAIPSLESEPQVSIGSAAPLASDASPGLGNPLWAIPLAALTATRDRPIFSRSRRPPPSVQSEPVRAVPPPVVVDQPVRPLLTLLGAIAGDADGIAILVDENTKNVVRMKTGETISGWTLRLVGKRSATFEMASQVAILVIPPP